MSLHQLTLYTITETKTGIRRGEEWRCSSVVPKVVFGAEIGVCSAGGSEKQRHTGHTDGEGKPAALPSI